MAHSTQHSILPSVSEGSPGSPSCSTTLHINNHIINHSLTNSNLLGLAERAAEAFGCDIHHLLQGTAPPKVQDAEVASCPGGRRSRRAIEEDTAKKRNALANALADVLLEFLWRSSRGAFSNCRCSEDDNSFDSPPPPAELPSTQTARPFLKSKRASVNGAGDELYRSARGRSSPRPTSAPQLETTPQPPLSPRSTPPDNIKPPPPPPPVSVPLIELSREEENRQSDDGHESSSPLSLKPSSSFLRGSRRASLAHQFFHQQESVGDPERQPSVALTAVASNGDIRSAFASTTDFAFASIIPQTVTMATFLKKVDDAAASASGVSAGIPIEFTATHKVNQAQASDTKHWVLNSRYEFLNQLGTGGQGAVWRVADLSTGEHLAIKIVRRGKMQKHRRRFSVADGRRASVGLFAREISGSLDDDDNDDSDDEPKFPPRHHSHSSATATSIESSTLDGSALLAQSAEVLRLFYEGGATDSALSENLAMEIVMGLFRHPNTIPLYEVIDDPGCNNVFLVMPLAKPLPFSLNLISGRLTAKGPSIDTILGYAREAASALSVFHAAGIIHCDIKLDNLLILPKPSELDNDKKIDVLVIADFGVCQLSVGSQNLEGHLNLLGGGNGTLAYWAPECFAAKKQSETFTAASDCYALGLCLYAMVFGQFPYWTADVMNPLSWEKVVPGTERYTGSTSRVRIPPIPGGSSHANLSAILRGLLDPVARERMTAKKVVELAQ